ncbi:MAG: TauD/TfdA family dioxygenase [Novosphingobium sp.]|nr:TauD/TfdA family dioxygenase [Novosphingobium sp.]
MTVTVKPLSDDLPYGARISGVTRESLKDEANRELIKTTFEERGVVIFEDVEQSGEMQIEVSKAIGPLKDHPVKTVERSDEDIVPGVIVIRSDGDGATVEIDGKQLVTWQPWHFDHCYQNELNRAGVLRSVSLPAQDGLTGFADGIQIWNDLPEDLRAKIDGKEIIYTLFLLYGDMKYDLEGLKVIEDAKDEIYEYAATLPRAIHPAVWQRETGEKVFHMSPWMSFGVVGDETPEGDALFEEVWAAAKKVMKPYFHQWQGTEMVAWDNHRMLHRGTGSSPDELRVMHRTTIQGDYGLGHWEEGGRLAKRWVSEPAE